MSGHRPSGDIVTAAPIRRLDPETLRQPVRVVDRLHRTRTLPSVEQRLKRRLTGVHDPAGCWEWQGRRNGKGYGCIAITNDDGFATWLTHRVAFALHYGVDPAELLVLHRCDNPPCCNPSHLFLGTNADNSADKFAKGRQRFLRGEQHPSTVLSDEQVTEVRARAAAGATHRSIAESFGVSRSHVTRLVRHLARSA